MKTNGYKMTSHCILFICIVIFSISAIGQRNDCFEIKYLDYFDLPSHDSVPLDIAQWEKLLDDKGVAEDKKGTLFFIPFIISSIKEYHPFCNTKKDTADYRVLTRVYCAIRDIDIKTLRNKTLSGQLEFLRDDFYQLVQNDSLLPYMSYTMDDGPFYGKDNSYTEAKGNQMFLTAFGTLVISKCSKEEICITVIDQKGRIRWTKKMVKNNGNPIQNISFNKENIYKTSLGYTIVMSGDGERLTLYLKDNGDFRFFFHSW